MGRITKVEYHVSGNVDKLGWPFCNINKAISLREKTLNYRKTVHKDAVSVVPSAKKIDFLNVRITDKSLFINANKICKYHIELSIAHYARVRQSVLRCYSCHNKRHVAEECLQGDSGLSKCYIIIIRNLQIISSRVVLKL